MLYETRDNAHLFAIMSYDFEDWNIWLVGTSDQYLCWFDQSDFVPPAGTLSL
jgi:hypothetical protein